MTRSFREGVWGGFFCSACPVGQGRAVVLLIFFLYKGQGFINCVQGQFQVFFSVPKADVRMMVG
jgi:hypothetical protein